MSTSQSIKLYTAKSHLKDALKDFAQLEKERTFRGCRVARKKLAEAERENRTFVPIMIQELQLKLVKAMLSRRHI